MKDCQESELILGLTAVIVAVKGYEAKVLTLDGEAPGLPFGSFHPEKHRTLELALRDWVDEQTGMRLGYVEQLYTFGNRHRDPKSAHSLTRIITVGYLALVPQDSEAKTSQSRWSDWYQFLPWEDHRRGKPPILENVVFPQLFDWVRQAPESEINNRLERIAGAFGSEKSPWDPERAIQRFELLYEAGLVLESHRDWSAYGEEERFKLPISQKKMDDPAILETARSMGPPMDQDHRRILASSIGRLRGKLKYRPLVFELIPEEFTLLHIQKVVEALSGVLLHKQNFRRLLIHGGLVKETSTKDASQPGRPAALFRFRKSVLQERPAQGVGLPQARI